MSDRLGARIRSVGRAWTVFRHNTAAMVGLVLLGGFLALGALHRLLLATVWPLGVYHPEAGFDRAVMHPAGISLAHPLGTDVLGRDVASMLMASAWPTLRLGLTAAGVTMLVGITIASLSAFYRGSVDWILGRISDALLILPAPILMVILGGTFSQALTPTRFGIIYGLLAGAGGTAIVLRSHALAVMTQPFIDAARVAGAGGRRIILHHLLPQIAPLAAGYMLIAATGVVVADGFLAFLGLTDTRLNWGTMMYWSIYLQGLSDRIAWNVFISAAAAISLFCAAFYLIGLGLRDLAEPEQARERGRKT